MMRRGSQGLLEHRDFKSGEGDVNLLRDEDVETIELDGQKVVAIYVPRADYNTRPVFINNNPLRGTFIRNHEGDYHCPEEMVTMMMRDANHEGNDRLFLKHYTMDDIDIPTLERYRQHFHAGILTIRLTISTMQSSCARWAVSRWIARVEWSV